MLDFSILSPEMIGAAAAVVAAAISLIPSLGENDSRRAWVAIAVIVLFVLGQNNFVYSNIQELFNSVMGAAVYALVTYKAILQPIVIPATNNTLASMGIKPHYLG